MMSGHERDNLRAAVRDAIHEALADMRGAPNPAAGEPVRIASNADLAAFVKRLAALMADPACAARIASGAHRFSLAAGSAGSAAGTATPQAHPPHAGLVNEKAVAALPDGATLHLAPTALVTPLARDRARQRRIKLERIR